MAASLFEHGTISTTREKAKFVQPFAEKLITLAKKGDLHARRRAIALLQDRAICTVENDVPEKVGTVIGKLFREIGPRFAERNGGYTRVINLPLRRVGDSGQLVLLQLVQEEATARAARQSTAAPAPDVQSEPVPQPASPEAPAAEPDKTPPAEPAPDDARDESPEPEK